MKVAVYSTKTCPYCIKVKRWLSDRAIAYDDIYVDVDPLAMKRMIEISGQMSVPYTTVEANDGTMQGVIGYDEARLKNILDIE